MAEEMSRRERRRQERKEKKQEQKRQQQAQKKKKEFLTYTGVLAVIVVLLAVGYAIAQNAEVKTDDSGATPDLQNMSEDELLSYNLQSHQNAARHIHAQLDIEILGQDRSIPAQIGIGPNTMRVVHTHDNSGKIHVEPPVPVEVTLGNFFSVWGKTFNSSCVFDYCENATHKLSMYVNGDVNQQYGDKVLREGEQISLIYEKTG